MECEVEFIVNKFYPPIRYFQYFKKPLENIYFMLFNCPAYHKLFYFLLNNNSILYFLLLSSNPAYNGVFLCFNMGLPYSIFLFVEKMNVTNSLKSAVKYRKTGENEERKENKSDQIPISPNICSCKLIFLGLLGSRRLRGTGWRTTSNPPSN